MSAIIFPFVDFNCRKNNLETAFPSKNDILVIIRGDYFDKCNGRTDGADREGIDSYQSN